MRTFTYRDGALLDEWGMRARPFSLGDEMKTAKAVEASGPAKECWHRILRFFQGDHYRALVWFSDPHPLLGDVAPITMLAEGRGDKLLAWVQLQLNET